MQTPTLTASIANFVASFPYADVPARSIDTAREAFIDLVGVMLAGRAEPVVSVLLKKTRADAASDAPCSVLLDPGVRRDAAAAALVDGAAAHALDYDDVQFNAHPSTVLVPAILAEAERNGASGMDALRAYVLGYEVWGELHGRESDPYHDKGWHPTAVLGTVAATAAVAFLRRFDARASRTALSIAASFTGGVLANFGSMTKPMHAGKAAAAAIEAADLAQAGLSAGADAIGARDGLLAALSPKGRVDLESRTQLGNRWFSVTAPPQFKKYPVCFSAHRAIDGVLALAQPHRLGAQDVAWIDVGIRGTQARVLRFDRPQTALEAKFSLQFAVACALLRGGVGLVDLDDAFVASEAVQSLFDKVRFTHLPPHADGTPPTADRVAIQTRDGRLLDSGPIGQATPHTRLKDKFMDCCAAGNDRRGNALFSALATLDTLADMRTLALSHPNPLQST